MPEDAKPASGRDPSAMDVAPGPGTIQIRSGDRPAEAAAPELPTLRGDARVLEHAATPPAMPPARYELGEEIARGGMGRVVEATDTLLGRVVALKEALALDPDSLRRFARETKITARLEHPAIVPVHDAGTMGPGAPFYVMRKIGGEPLEKLVAKASRLDERLALLPHIVAASHAIAHAHDRGIVHRDIKPSNILCGSHGETMVIDWGLAKVIGEADEPTAPANVDPEDAVKTRAGIVFGTPGFMAPEQLRGIVVDERCDVYALGATLYHLLSRKPPHYAKTADAMMRAAASAPPAPIGELVPGVPRELATIVDKALAHDPQARYQRAGELARDLQAFLAGQLVASHHYTPREKLVRFVRKNRVPVLAIGAAILALAIGGTIAVTRVIGERDRADVEAQKARSSEAVARESQRRAEDRNEKLVLQQARGKVTSNPTEAIAMVKPLATKQWREVRSIATAARANGVAWSLPAPRRTETLELSRDGQRALVAGDDGSVRVYDLARREVRVLVARGPKLAARFADSERTIVVWSGERLAVLDSATGALRSELVVAAPIRDLEVVGVHAYWIDERDRKLWMVDLASGGGLAGKVPLELLVDERLDQVAPSPDGRWLALLGEAHLLLHDRTQPALPPVEVLFGKVRDLDWADDGTHLAALVELGEPTERQVVDVEVGSGPQIVHRIRVGNRQFVAFSKLAGAEPRMYTIGPMGVGMASRVEIAARKQLVGEPIAVRESIDGAVVAGSTGGLAILTDDGDHSVQVPTGRLEIVDASARAPYVVGMIEGRMLVWNLREILPRRLAVQPPTLEELAGTERVFAAFLDAPAAWIDLATGARTETAALPGGLLDLASSPDGQRVCVIDSGHQATLLKHGRKVPEDIGRADVALFAGDVLVLGTEAGTVETFELESRQRTLLASRSAKLVHLTASRRDPGSPDHPGWLAAVFADGTLWRYNLATGLQNVHAIGGVPRGLAIDSDGTVAFGLGRELRAWRASGAIEKLAELPKDIDALGIAGPRRAVAFADTGTAYVLALDAPSRDVRPFEIHSLRAAMSPDTGLIVSANRGSLELIDPLLALPHRWTLASSPGLTFGNPQIASDGRHVIARRVVVDREKKDVEARAVSVLLAWRLVLPATADETAKWLDEMTNAVVDPQTSELGWQ